MLMRLMAECMAREPGSRPRFAALVQLLAAALRAEAGALAWPGAAPPAGTPGPGPSTGETAL